jgi:hypothetical protein
MEIVARQRVRYVFKDDIDDDPNQGKPESRETKSKSLTQIMADRIYEKS